MKKQWKASMTIEAAIIIPFLIFLLGGIITVLVYYHDKNVVIAAAYEIGAVGSASEEIEEEELGSQLQERVTKKLLLFSGIYVDVQIEKTNLRIGCQASKGRMMLRVQLNMSRTDPETFIRNIRKIEKIENQMGEK